MFIAEIGINHNGDMSVARELIQMAKRAGADYVKFQKRDLDICITESVGRQSKETPWGAMSYREYKERIEFEKEEFDDIDALCKEIDIKWFASVWDIPSLEFISGYDVPYIKIPSACITDLELLAAVAEKEIPVIISTGMSTEEEVEAAVDVLGSRGLTIMHCNSSYPADEDELDLLVIHTLIDKYPKSTIGYSGHEKGVFPTIIAAVVGAEVIERHITLDQRMWGTDQEASLTESQLTYLIEKLKRLDRWLGSEMIKVYDSEKKVRSKLRKKTYEEGDDRGKRFEGSLRREA